MRLITLSIIILFFLTAVPSFAQSLSIDNPTVKSGPTIKKTYVSEPVFNSQVYMVETGKRGAETIVLIHGIGDEGTRNWEKLIPALAPNYHVVTFDLPGFGFSEKGNHLYSPKNYATFVKWVIDTYADGPVILLGHSMGGGIALRFAADYPERLSRLILVDAAGILHRSVLTRYMASFSPKKGWQQLFSQSFKSLNEALGNAFDRLEADGLPVDLNVVLNNSVLRKLFFQSKPKNIAALALVQEDFSAALDSVKVPTNIIWGEEDQVAPLRTARLLAAKIHGSQLDIIGGGGHVLILHKSELFNRVLLDALSRSPVASGYTDPLPMPGERKGWCEGGRGTVFSGAYDRIEIKGCKDVKLDGVSARELYIQDSQVTIENSLVKSKETAITVKDSKVTATILSIEGDIAIISSNSSFDLAGVNITTGKDAIKTSNVSSLLFSVSHISSSRYRGYIHGRRVVTPDGPL